MKFVSRCGRAVALVAGLASGVGQAWAGGTPTATTLAMTVAGSGVTTVPTGTVITLAATVTSVGGGAAVVFPGTVNFCDATAAYCADIHLLGTAQLTSAGVATLTFIPGNGKHSYKAVFLGTGKAAGSASSVTPLMVTGTYPSVTTLTASGSVGNYTLSAEVTGSGPFPPVGTISFYDTNNANYVLGTGTLSSATKGLDFVNSATTANGIGPQSSALGDFNGDGKKDMAVAARDSNTVTILLGNGDGTFAPGVDIAVGLLPIDIVTGDFNNDGKLDLAVTNQGGRNVTVLLGNGDGTFVTQPTVPVGNGPFAAAIGDFNNDGQLDLAVANKDDSTLSILLGNGDGTFTLAETIPTGSMPSAVLAADFNGDGNVDLATADYGGTELTILLGKGDGTFTQGTSPLTNNEPWWLVPADFNGDGKADIAVADQSSGFLTILLGNGDGTFTRTPVSPPVYGAPSYTDAMAVGDFNGDGKADLAATDSSYNSLVVMLGNGDGTFTQTTSPATGAHPTFVLAADFNGDGNMDLAVVNYGDNTSTVLLSESAATATLSGVSVVGTGTHVVEAAFPGDTNFTASDGTLPLTAEPVPTTLTLSAAPGTTFYTQQVVLTAVLAPTLAQTHTEGGSITFYSNGVSVGTGTISNGVATLNLTSLPVGTESLSAMYPGDLNFVTSTSNTLPFVVSPDVPVITFVVPNHTFGDAPFAVAATSNSAGAITYSVVSGPATMVGSTVMLTGAGTVVLQASQAANGIYGAGTQDATFNVAKEAQTITFVQPASPVTLGVVPITLVATASSGLPVSFSVVSGPGLLSGGVLTITGAGTVVVAADQAGNADFAAAVEVTRVIAVSRLTPAITLTATPAAVFVENPFTLTATVTSPVGSPTGAITFYDGGVAMATVTMSGGTASFTYSSTTVGGHGTTASYSGDTNFTPAASAAVIVPVEDFRVTVAGNASPTVLHGTAAVYSLAVTVLGGTTTPAAISFGMTGAPRYSQISFSPQPLAAASGASTVTLTVLTPDFPSPPWVSRNGGGDAVLAMLGLGGLVLGFRRRSRWKRLAGVLVLLVGAIAATGLSGCGSGWGSEVFSLAVRANSGPLEHVTNMSFTEH